MAEQRLNTRIISKHITLAQANEGTWKPYEGEIVLARVDTQQPDGHGGVTVVPTYLMKVGAKDTDGNLIAIKDLKWTHAPASDVYAWAKQQKLAITTSGSGNVISNIEATDAGITITKTTVATTDSITTLEGEIDALQEALAQEVTDRGAADTTLDNKITAINQNLDGTTEGGIGKRLAAVEGVASGAASKAGELETAFNTYKNTTVPAELAKLVTNEAYNAKMAAIDAETADIRVDFAAADEALHTTISGEIATAKSEAITKAGELDAAQYNTITGEYTQAITNAQNTLQGNINTLSNTVEANKSANDTAHTGFTNAIEALQEKVANVSNVMDFVGVASSVTVTEGVISITVEGVDAFQKGDVVVSTDGKEYVYDGSAWHEFGSTTATDAAIVEVAQDLADFEAEVARDYATKQELSAETSARTTAISDLDAAYKKAVADLKTELTEDIGEANTDAYDRAVAEAARLDGVQTTAITTAYEKAIGDTKTAIETAQAAVDSAQNTKITALEDEVNGKDDVKGLRTLITEEASRADAAEKANAAAIDAISKDYLKAADKTELANATSAVANNLSTLSGTVEANKQDVDTNFVKVVDGELTVAGNVIIFDCGGVEEA